jgi:hypothetical protein
MWTTAGAVALAAFAYLALHARPNSTGATFPLAGVSRAAPPISAPVPAPAPTQGVDAPSIPEAEPAPPVLEVSSLARDAPTRLAPAGKARLHRATVARARAVAPLRERQPERASLRLAPPSAPPVEPRNDPAPAAAIPEKSVSHDDMGQDLNSLPQSHHPRSIDQDNPFR